MEVLDVITAQVKPVSLGMSYEEFLQWADEDIHAEWVNGEVVVHMPPKDIHQAMLGFLYELLSLFNRLFNLGKLRVAPLEVRLWPGGPSREPDILFVANENLDRLTEDRLVGPADLIIEIVSEDSARRDRAEKFQEYRDAGVREYWVIDPRPGKQRADFYHLNERGQYELFAIEDDERVASRVLPGFWLRPAWLWQANTLNPLTCTLEIEGVAAALVRQVQQAQSEGRAEG